MKAIDRIEELINFYNLSIREFESKIGTKTNSIQAAIRRKASVKDDTLNRVLKTFTGVNAEWLLSGRGEMFVKSNQETIPILTSDQKVQEINDLLKKVIKEEDIQKRMEIISKIMWCVNSLRDECQINHQNYVTYLKKFTELTEFIIEKEGFKNIKTE